jgi:lysozyme
MALLGVDVSGWNPGINFKPLPADFAIIKATGGTGYQNPYAAAQFANARAAGTRTGLYHFAHEIGYQGGAVQEADAFIARGAQLGAWDGHTLPVLDWESDNQADTLWALTFLRRCYSVLKVRPWIYLNGQNSRAYNWSQVAAEGYACWYAQYAVTTPTFNYYMYDGVTPAASVAAPKLPWGLTCAAWQFADNMRLPTYGGGLDASVLYGDGGTFDAYARGDRQTQAAPAPAAPAGPALLIPGLPGITLP